VPVARRADFNVDGFLSPDDLSDFITCLEVQFPGRARNPISTQTPS
jgi:hypothetical protein